MPCFNAEQFVKESVESVLGQRNADFELIVVDGGSSDATLDIVHTYPQENIKIISEPDRGVTDALNKGFALATGDIFCWLNADDVYVSDNALSTALKSFNKYRSDVIYGHSLCLDKAGNITKSLYTWRTDCNGYKCGANVFTGSAFFSRDAWRQFGGFSLKHKVAFERELFDFLFCEKKTVLANSFFSALRHHPDTLTARYADLIREESINIRGQQKPQNRQLCRLKRLFSQLSDGSIFRVTLNRYRDRHSGRHWSAIYHEESTGNRD